MFNCRAVADDGEADAQAFAITQGAGNAKAAAHMTKAQRRTTVAAHDDCAVCCGYGFLPYMGVEVQQLWFAMEKCYKVRERRHSSLRVEPLIHRFDEGHVGRRID